MATTKLELNSAVRVGREGRTWICSVEGHEGRGLEGVRVEGRVEAAPADDNRAGPAPAHKPGLFLVGELGALAHRVGFHSQLGMQIGSSGKGALLQGYLVGNICTLVGPRSVPVSTSTKRPAVGVT